MKLFKFKMILKNEAGQVLPMALILMILGGFLVVPMLSLMTTNLTATRYVDRANMEVYAADAGVEMVLWNLQYNQYDPQQNPDGFKLPEDGQTIPVSMETLNEKTVVAEISKPVDEPFKVTSTATSTDGHSTTIICRANAQADYSWFFDAAITSANDVEIGSNTDVTGDVVFGGDLDNKGEIDGEVVEEGSLAENWPSADYLSDYYLAQVADNISTPFPDSEITISGSRENPTSIPQLYRIGDLLLKGGGWARFDGTVYVTGTLTVNPTGDCVLDLNDNTIFSAYDAGEAIFVGPKTILRGSGCWIAVGDITFNPQLGSTGNKLVGVDYTTSSDDNESNNTLLLSKFTAETDGFVETFSVLTNGDSGYVKLALYTDSGGQPGTLLAQTPLTPPIAVDAGVNASGLNDIIGFPKTEVTAGNSYWLAAISDASVIRYRTFTYPDTWVSKTKAQTYDEGFTFPATLIDLTLVTDRQYCLAGNALPFVFIMSIEGTSTLQPQGTLYGSIAGDTMVDLQPQCTLTLTDVPASGLEFPGMMPGGGSGTTGTPPTVLSFTIQ